jgi:hypothetical protein
MKERVLSIALPWSEFKSYCETVGPGRKRVPRPQQCIFCEYERVWFNGWRRVLPTLIVDEQPHRPADWVWLQRVRCARTECGRSWTLPPPWLYPHRSLQPDLSEQAALAYLLDPQASYVSVARVVGCAWVTVWRWVGWIAALTTSAALLAQAARLGAGSGADPAQLPRLIPAAARARSRRRAQIVQRAAHVLIALALLHRSQPEPPADPSPLRWWIMAAFLTFRRLAYVTRPGLSPPLYISH